MLVVLMVVYGVAPSPAIVLFPLFVLLASFTAIGVGTFLASLNALYRDIRYIIPFAIQAWLLISPVGYPASLVESECGEKCGFLLALNPMAGIIEGFRWSVTGEGTPPLNLILVSVGITSILTIIGIRFSQKDRRPGRRRRIDDSTGDSRRKLKQTLFHR